MAEFDITAPKKAQTDPKNQGAQRVHFPKHVYRSAAGPGEAAIVVAWHGKAPIYNDVLSVGDADALSAALADGYAAAPVLGDGDAKKSKK